MNATFRNNRSNLNEKSIDDYSEYELYKNFPLEMHIATTFGGKKNSYDSV
jgi:hypothetical protein